MPEGEALPLKDEIERLHHLGDVGRGASIERRLDDRLVGAGPAAEGALEGRIRAESSVDLGEAVRAGEDRDQGVFKLLQGRVLDRLLMDAKLFPDRREQVERAELDPDGGQASARREPRGGCGFCCFHRRLLRYSERRRMRGVNYR